MGDLIRTVDRYVTGCRCYEHIINYQYFEPTYTNGNFIDLTCNAEGLSAITLAASRSAFDAFCSPTAAITFKNSISHTIHLTNH